jgi:hypothetical protein
VNTIDKLSLRGTKWLRGAAEANPEIPRAARNKLRNPMRLPRFARNDSSIHVHLFMTFTIFMKMIPEELVEETDKEDNGSMFEYSC